MAQRDSQNRLTFAGMQTVINEGGSVQLAGHGIISSIADLNAALPNGQTDLDAIYAQVTADAASNTSLQATLDTTAAQLTALRSKPR